MEQKFKMWHKDIVTRAASILQESSAGVDNAPKLVQLYTLACQNDTGKKALQIMANFRKAAFHLQYILQAFTFILHLIL